MTNHKTIAALALGALVASTSLAAAGGKQVEPDKTIISDGSGVVFIPIKVEPVEPQKPQIPYIPLDVDFDPPAEPQIPYIPLGIDFDQPDQPDIPIIPGVIDVFNKKPQAAEGDMLLVDCLVKGTTPTTDDLWIVNVGNVELPAGFKIKFAVPSSDDRGAFRLNHAIAAGQKVKVAGMLHDAQSGAPCRAQII